MAAPRDARSAPGPPSPPRHAAPRVAGDVTVPGPAATAPLCFLLRSEVISARGGVSVGQRCHRAGVEGARGPRGRAAQRFSVIEAGRCQFENFYRLESRVEGRGGLAPGAGPRSSLCEQRVGRASPGPQVGVTCRLAPRAAGNVNPECPSGPVPRPPVLSATPSARPSASPQQSPGSEFSLQGPRHPSGSQMAPLLLKSWGCPAHEGATCCHTWLLQFELKSIKIR